MKKFTILMAVIAIMGSNAAFAQSNTGKAAAASANTGSNNMAWLVGIGTVGVLGTVVGITAASASSEPSTYGH